jgi:hypothetical protein
MTVERTKVQGVQERVLRKTTELKIEEVKGRYSKLHNDERHALYNSSNIFGVIKLRKMKLARHVAGTGGNQTDTGLW